MGNSLPIVDLIIRGGTVVSAIGQQRADLVIFDGKVAGLLTPREVCPSARELDASGCFVLPGAVDAHVHLDEPTLPEEPGFVDDFLTGTRAAVHGGVTTVGQMSFAEGSSLSTAVDRDRVRAGSQAIVNRR